MKIGSLCTGYGGLDMAVQSIFDGNLAWYAEYDKHAAKIMEKHEPGVENLKDLTKIRWDEIVPVDILTAGYPCQPFSGAGKREGTNDPRHLFPYIAQAIRTIRPSLVILENVRGHLTLGFDSVLLELAAIGYDARWHLVRASDVGAPHQRARLFVIAYPNNDESFRDLPRLRGGHSARFNLQLREGNEHSNKSDHDFGQFTNAMARWSKLMGPPPEPVNNGQISPRFVEWMMGLNFGHVTDVGLSRNNEIKALGNGVVPQQAAHALKLLLK
tara:strand:+ start:284 stop:1096 length:813 start_codon:yes stop_codon:yes gene_type:complete